MIEGQREKRRERKTDRQKAKEIERKTYGKNR